MGFYLTLSPDNSAVSVLRSFLSGVEEFGLPSRVRLVIAYYHLHNGLTNILY
jgi:hypothetical protein